MPFIHIRSLPSARPSDVGAALEGLSRDFAAATGVGLEHVTATWSFFEPGHYAVAGCAAAEQPAETHPVLVELLAPDINSAETVETMLTAIAEGLVRHAGVSSGNLFVNAREARSGRVFDAGGIVRW